MICKTEQIKNALIDNNIPLAIRLSSRFFDRSEDTKLFKTAQSAIRNPNFYRQIGKSPDAIIDQAEKRLRDRFLNNGKS
jgi:sigma54-dependent transcription regulator